QRREQGYNKRNKNLHSGSLFFFLPIVFRIIAKFGSASCYQSGTKYWSLLQNFDLVIDGEKERQAE
ncbi:MAG: hypothetical protein VYA05_06585, partial [Pseudomonadota bacterium]|nr:hypothetical protein [Pseudomonadota bacterium]